jgi:hypothetical protein
VSPAGATPAGLALVALLAGCGAPERKLIQFGWGEPDTAFLRRHVRQMETAPFDGCVYNVRFEPAAGLRGNLAWDAWGRQAVAPAALEPARRDLEATRFERFRHNFVRMNVTPGDVDWFDDFGPVLANARSLARLARLAGSDGVLLDTEAYAAPLFHHPSRPQAGQRDFAEYARQARRRGAELMHAFEAEYPGLTLLLTFGHSAPWWEMHRYDKPLEECGYGLLAGFVDGLIDGARRGRIVDGYELSYGFRETGRFAAARRSLASELLPIVARPGRYRRHVSAGFGLWMDYDRPRLGWDARVPERNYFTPRGLQRSLEAAFAAADEYVWLYSETPRWWSETGERVALPDAYERAIRRARRSAGLKP